MHSAAAWPRPAVRGTRPVSERRQSPPAPRPAQGKCPAGRSRPRRQAAGAGSLISPDGIVSEEGLLSHKRTRTTAAMLVAGATAIVPCSHSAGNSQPPARRMRNAAPCPWTAKGAAVAETSSTVQKHPWTIMDTGWRRHRQRHLPADGRRRHSCFAPYAGARAGLAHSSANGTLWYRVATTIWAVAICRISSVTVSAGSAASSAASSPGRWARRFQPIGPEEITSLRCSCIRAAAL